MQQIIVFDMDEVLVNIRDVMQEVLGELTGKMIPWTEWHSYYMPDNYGISLDECLAAFIEHEVLERATLEPYAREAVAIARAEGYKTAIITARRWHPNGTKVTRDWLAAHNIYVDELMVVDIDVKKSSVMKVLGNVVYMIDDNADHVHDSLDTNASQNSFVMHRPWNIRETDLPRVRNLEEFVEVFKQCA